MFEILEGRQEWAACLMHAREAEDACDKNYNAKSVKCLHVATVYAMHNFLNRYLLPYDERHTLLVLLQESNGRDYLPDQMYSHLLYIAIMGDIALRKKRSIEYYEACECMERLDAFVNWLLQED